MAMVVVVVAATAAVGVEVAMAVVAAVVAVEVDGGRWRWRKFSLVAKANHLLTRRRKSIGVHLLTGDRCPGLLSLYR